MNINEMEEDNNKCDIDDEEDDNPSIDDTPNWNILKNEVDQLLDKIQDVVQAEIFSFKNAFSQNVKSTQDLAPPYRKKPKQQSESQFQVQQAKILLEKIQGSCPNILESNFRYFNIYIIVPIFISLGRQTIDRFQQFILEHEDEFFLQDFEADKSEKAVNEHVLRNTGKPKVKMKEESEESKFKKLKEDILSQKETLFYIVHDEAHYAFTPGNHVDLLLNDPKISAAENVILLQVTATPYNLITKNSRIYEENCHDMYERYKNKELTENKYYSIGDFVDTTKNGNYGNDELTPGTFVKDENYEDLISKNPKEKETISLRSFIGGKLGITNKKELASSRVEYPTRLYGLLFLYIGAFLKKFGFQEELNTSIGQFLKYRDDGNTITYKTIKDIDKNLETGHMVLIRILKAIPGKFFVETLRKLRDILGFNDKFSILLDIDEKTNGKRELCEDQFLPRLKRWNRNPDFRVRNYTDLEQLPVLLVVVDKGKMGITYPSSLRYYDLRMRYGGKSENTTRSALEQDFGRACRYKTSDGPPLPTVLLNIKCEEQIRGNKYKSRGSLAKDTTGVYKLDPDYKDKMKSKTKAVYEVYPKNDFDLKPYFAHWVAGKDHVDSKNQGNKKFKNRFLLYGRPQLGKTGVFLHLGYLLWQKINKPKYSHPKYENAPTIEYEVPEVDDDSADDESSDTEKVEDKSLDPNTMKQFPNFEEITRLQLEKPSISKSYGDPNNIEVMSWYKAGNTYPHESVYNKLNKTVRRAQVLTSTSKSTKRNLNMNNVPSSYSEVEHNQFYSQSLKDHNRKYEVNYRVFQMNHNQEFKGTLHIPTCSFLKKWISLNDFPILRRTCTLYPPIFIPSSGRWNSALLDLSKSGLENGSYIQVVIIREEEKENYQNLFKWYDQIIFFVISDTLPKTVGTTRNVAKLLAEKITENSGMNWAMMLDDNIHCWEGITLINDPHPQFDIEPSHKKSQRSSISFKQLLDNFTNKNLHDQKLSLNKFSIIGFSMANFRNAAKRRYAYKRKHVFAAILLNLPNLRKIQYENMWAMEDIDFNNRTHNLSNENSDRGVLVKCLRFIAKKKQIKQGGVIATNVPEKELVLLKKHPKWPQRKINQSKEVSSDVDDASNTKGEKEKPKLNIDAKADIEGDSYSLKLLKTHNITEDEMIKVIKSNKKEDNYDRKMNESVSLLAEDKDQNLMEEDTSNTKGEKEKPKLNSETKADFEDFYEDTYSWPDISDSEFDARNEETNPEKLCNAPSRKDIVHTYEKSQTVKDEKYEALKLKEEKYEALKLALGLTENDVENLLKSSPIKKQSEQHVNRLETKKEPITFISEDSARVSQQRKSEDAVSERSTSSSQSVANKRIYEETPPASKVQKRN